MFRLSLYMLVGLMLGATFTLSFAAIAPSAPAGGIPFVTFQDPTRAAKCGGNPSGLPPGTGYYCATSVTNAQAVGQGCYLGGTSPSTWAYGGTGCTAGGNNAVYLKSLFNVPAGCTSGYLNADASCAPAPTCPANSSLTSGGTCTCNSAFTQTGNTCTSACTVGQIKSGFMAKTGNPATACFGACQGSIVSASNQFMNAGVQVISGEWELTGLACSDGTVATLGTPTAAPPGKCAGEVNGVTVFLPCSASTPGVSVSANKTTTTKADGTTVVNNGTTTTNNYGGSVSTSTTNTTTTTAPGGTPQTETTQKKEEKPTDSFCKENPNSPLCKTSSWGGSCAAFACDGDAVQCAIAKEQHSRNCKLYDTATALSTLGDQVTAGADPLAATLPSSSNPSVVNLPSSFDQSNVLTGGCITDLTLSIRGTPFIVPLSAMCPYLEIMGSLLVAISLLSGVRLALGGIA